MRPTRFFFVVSFTLPFGNSEIEVAISGYGSAWFLVSQVHDLDPRLSGGSAVGTLSSVGNAALVVDRFAGRPISAPCEYSLRRGTIWYSARGDCSGTGSKMDDLFGELAPLAC